MPSEAVQNIRYGTGTNLKTLHSYPTFPAILRATLPPNFEQLDPHKNI